MFFFKIGFSQEISHVDFAAKVAVKERIKKES